MPNGRLASEAATATFRLSAITVISSGLNTRASAQAEAVAAEDLAGFGRMQPAQECVDLWMRAGGDLRHRIDDVRMRLRGKRRHDPHPRLDHGIAGVDHAQRRLAA